MAKQFPIELYLQAAMNQKSDMQRLGSGIGKITNKLYNLKEARDLKAEKVASEQQKTKAGIIEKLIGAGYNAYTTTPEGTRTPIPSDKLLEMASTGVAVPGITWEKDTESDSVTPYTYDSVKGKYYDKDGKEVSSLSKNREVRNLYKEEKSLEDKAKEALAIAQAKATGTATAQKPLPSESSAKLAMAKIGLQSIDEAYPLMFDPDGSLSRTSLMAANAPGGGVGTKGRLIYSKISDAVEAKLRAETGAAATTDEVKRIAKRYVPSGKFDTVTTVNDKMNRLRRFLKYAIITVDPTGKYNIKEDAYTDADWNNITAENPVQSQQEQPKTGTIKGKYATVNLE